MVVRRIDAIVTHLPLANHVRDFYSRQDDARTAEIFKPHHRLDGAFDGAVILLDDVVQVRHLHWLIEAQRGVTTHRLAKYVAHIYRIEAMKRLKEKAEISHKGK